MHSRGACQSRAKTSLRSLFLVAECLKGVRLWNLRAWVVDETWIVIWPVHSCQPREGLFYLESRPSTEDVPAVVFRAG